MQGDPRTQLRTTERTRHGFTIVELLIVIVVVGILAAIVLVAYNGITRQAREAAIKSDLRNAASTLEVDGVETGRYPWKNSEINDGQGLKASAENSVTYVPKPYGYCVQGTNPSVPSGFALRSNDNTITEGSCDATVSTAAGSTYGYQDGPVATAKFGCINGVISDDAGNIYVGTDDSPGRIRKITPSGIVSTLAEVGTTDPYCPKPRAIDKSGAVYFTSSDSAHSGRIWKATPSGVVSVYAGAGASGYLDSNSLATARFGQYIEGIAIDDSGNMFVADFSNKRIRKISPSGVVSTYAGSGAGGVMDGNGTAAQFQGPEGLALDRFGNLYVGDWNVLRKISPDREVTTVAGSAANWGYVDGVGAAAQLWELSYLAVDVTGAVYASEYDQNFVRKILPDGTVTTLAGSHAANYGLAEGTASDARFGALQGITVLPNGDVYVADTSNNRIRKVIQ